MLNCLPEARASISPEGGWKEHTHYVVDVAWRSGNPIHRRILSVGFLNGRTPLSGAYTKLLADDFETLSEYSDPDMAYYLKAVCEIPEMSRKTTLSRSSAHKICADAGIDPYAIKVERAAIEAHNTAGDVNA